MRDVFRGDVNLNHAISTVQIRIVITTDWVSLSFLKHYDRQDRFHCGDPLSLTSSNLERFWLRLISYIYILLNNETVMVALPTPHTLTTGTFPADLRITVWYTGTMATGT